MLNIIELEKKTIGCWRWIVFQVLAQKEFESYIILIE
jgi:hypothetical protein